MFHIYSAGSLISRDASTHSTKLSTPYYLCDDVVREGSMCLNHPELVHKDKTLHPNPCDKFDPVINPWRACAARVTLVGLPAVCMSLCLSTLILALQATRRPMSDTNDCRTTRTRKIKERFCWSNCVRERETFTVADRVAWPNPSISGAHAYYYAYYYFQACHKLFLRLGLHQNGSKFVCALEIKGDSNNRMQHCGCPPCIYSSAHIKLEN